MREAAVPGYRLSKARFSTKVLITLGMFGLLLGLGSAVALTLLRTGVTAASVQTYYLGSSAAASGEPISELDQALVVTQPRPVAELAEVTHLHLMGGSLLLFLLCHLLSVCDVDDRVRAGLYAISFCSFLATFGSPWLIVFIAPAFAHLYGASIVTLILSLAVLCLIPLREMWWTR